MTDFENTNPKVWKKTQKNIWEFTAAKWFFDLVLTQS